MIAKLGTVFRTIAAMALIASLLGALLAGVLMLFGGWVLFWYLVASVVVSFGAVRLSALNRRRQAREAAEVVAEAESYLIRKS